MKKLVIGLMLGSAMLFAAVPAQALVSVSADVPLQYTYKESGEAADSVSGVKIGIKLPILVGLGLETYTAESEDAGVKFSHSIQMLDVFYELPIPVINIALGLGLGQASAETNFGSYTYDNGFASQYWLSVGYAFAAVIDLHLGYHVVNGKVVGTDGATESKVDISGNMISLGVRIGL